MTNGKTDNTNFAIRWRPDFRYTNDKFIKVSTNNFTSTEPSVTDKEAYRVSLATLRGELAQGAGKIDVGSYSLKAGEAYNPNMDFSFLNRKDLTIVELDDYIKVMQRNLEESDDELSEQIKAELATAEKKRQSLEKDSTDKNNQVEK